MKKVISSRTVRSALGRADARLREIESSLSQLHEEMEKVKQLRAVLAAQLPKPELPVPQLVESGDCSWAIGHHMHQETVDGWLCLAPEEQARKP